jgi:S-DNA-T family DNA segregation ATPase FtsK/SpoIIIE
MTHYFGWWGAVVILLTIGLLGFLLVTEMAFLPVMVWISRGTRRQGIRILERVKGITVPSPIRVHLQTKPGAPSKPEPVKVAVVKKEPPRKEPLPPEIRIVEPPKRVKPPPIPKDSEPVLVKPEDFKLPSLDLLDPPATTPLRTQGKESLQANAKILEEALRDYGIEAKVTEVEMGPVITRYEVEPAPGVKVQKITTLSDDLALVLKSPSVRIVAPIPGKARIGVEVPNACFTLVSLREVLESAEFRDSSSRLTIALGKDAAGHPLVANLSEMPHLLIAGTTGSGKTVCVNALIMSILFNATPEQVRFIMVDPKRVELAPFNGLPHLILPVLSEPKQIPAALNWVVQEMETRYRLFAKLGVRNIEAYHEKKHQGQLPSEEIPEHLPYLVLIIDELADLMLVAQAEIEKTIARLAHLSRAVGIHMVLATQRPSVDVLTGVIKANFPARVSFQVASKVDSRTVLDTMGAEKLLGKGDLLFMQPGSSKLIRAQGTFVTDQEMERVVQFLEGQRQPTYDTSILEEHAPKGSEQVGSIRDSLYPEAVRIVVETGQASVSLLQRRMRLGYGRAARILDMMEEEGIVGPIRGAKPREVYLKEVPEVSETAK